MWRPIFFYYIGWRDPDTVKFKEVIRTNRIMNEWNDQRKVFRKNKWLSQVLKPYQSVVSEQGDCVDDRVADNWDGVEKKRS